MDEELDFIDDRLETIHEDSQFNNNYSNGFYNDDNDEDDGHSQSSNDENKSNQKTNHPISRKRKRLLSSKKKDSSSKSISSSDSNNNGSSSGRTRKRRLGTFTSKVGRRQGFGNMNSNTSSSDEEIEEENEMDSNNEKNGDHDYDHDDQSSILSSSNSTKSSSSKSIQSTQSRISNNSSSIRSIRSSSSSLSSSSRLRSSEMISSSSKRSTARSRSNKSSLTSVLSSSSSSSTRTTFSNETKHTNSSSIRTCTSSTSSTRNNIVIQTPPAPPTPQTPPSNDDNVSIDSNSNDGDDDDDDEKTKLITNVHVQKSTKRHEKYNNDIMNNNKNNNNNPNENKNEYKQIIQDDNTDNDHNDNDTNNNNDDDHDDHELSLIQDESQQSQKIIGAGTDVFGIQDAGSFRFVQDDCAYLCSSFLSSISSCTRNSHEEEERIHKLPIIPLSSTIKHNSTTADTICDLVNMISSKKTRDDLMNLGSGIENEFSQESFMSIHDDVDGDNNDDEKENNDTIQSILDVLSSIPSSIRGYSELSPSSTTKVFINGDDEEKESKSNHHQNTNCNINNSNSSQFRIKGYDGIVAEAQSLLAHFLSFDCTLNMKYSASSTIVAARSFRKTLLKHKGAMQGIARLLLADTVVANILLSSKRTTEQDGERITVQNNNKKVSLLDDEEDATNVNLTDDHLLSLDNSFSQDSMESITATTMSSSVPKPSKRKKRRLNFGSSNNNSATSSNINDEKQKCKEKHTGDPTKAGRRRKNRRSRSDPCDVQPSSTMTSTTTYTKSKYQLKLEKAYKHIAMSDNELKESHDTTNLVLDYTKNNPGFLALDALNRIITGKFDEGDNEEEDENGGSNNIDGQEEEDSSDLDDSDMECDELEKQNIRNPLIFRNVLIRRSGALPFLSRAMSESLEAAVLLHQASSAVVVDDNDDGHVKKQREYLRNRIHCLSSLLDTICCLSSENRRSLCHTAFVIGEEDPVRSVLIPSLLRTISLLPVAYSSCQSKSNSFADISLASYRTLTSLTHENDVAAQQLVKGYYVEANALIQHDQSQCPFHGVAILAKTLFNLVQQQQEVRGDNNARNLEAFRQHIYDAIVFTLNILTNVLETPSSNEARRIVSMMQIKNDFGKNNNERHSMLSWLTRWVVSQTSSFQDAVILDDSQTNEQSDPNEMSNSQQRDLEHHEDEFLVQAGNGFILIACFLLGETKEGKKDSVDEIAFDQKVREQIMNEMPRSANGNSMGITLVVNTLKAFCNYYKFSIGDLSVAVVDPVRKLILRLEAMQN